MTRFVRTLLLLLLSLEALPCLHAQGNAPGAASIDGWSFGSELAPTESGKDTLTLQPGHPELIVFFHAGGGQQALLRPQIFRYRLTGLSDDWTETRSSSAHFWMLSPGDYQFQVQAALPGGGWPSQMATLHVVQKPFFYQTWYAAVMVCAFLIAVCVQLLRQRDQLLKGQMAMVLDERNRIASECHDTLMAGFAAVSWQLEATSQQMSNDAPEQREALQSLELARSMMGHCQAEARRIIWDLRNSDRITNLLSESLADAMDAHRMRDDLQASLTVVGEEVNLSPSAVHHLTCIGQEAMTNALRHAGGSSIQVELEYSADSLSLSVRDDGCGFVVQDRQVRAGHFGISVMEERTRKLGGQLRLTSAVNKGTEVVVTVKFRGIQQPSVQQPAVVRWIGV
ncbi:ATP-binding protein [Terriglobus aquaticus]|uniref:ATP-binding protein n=1 Tax=Terriglobus aquaticus TaxID=940139 RepID=A0ABW9KJP2_9BACT|nr:ATP-binding protein [Terriglobus aquaticus]